jgi:lipid A 3-O-deacylase
MELKRAAIVAFISCVLSGPAAACCDEERWSSRILFENDLFGGSDRYYTNGARLEFIAAPRRIPEESWFSSASFETAQTTYFAAQYIYTAADIAIADPPLDDRPYAGWLYGGVQLARVDPTATVQDTISAFVGVIGPSARAEEAQNAVHRWRGFDEAQGWDTQMRDELTLDASYERRWRFPFVAGHMDAIPHAAINLGTTFRQIRGGSMLRVGYNLPRDLGVAPIAPVSLLGLQGAAEARFRAYAFAGVEMRGVQHNTFLDGALFTDSRSVDKERFVFEQRYGAVLGYERTCSLAYIFVVRSKEFETQLHAQSYGSVQLVLPLWR